MAINPNTDFSSGAVLTAAQQNRFPRGIMGYAESTGLDTYTTSEALKLTAVTFTAVANRYYRLTYFEPTIQLASGTSQTSEMRIRKDNATGTVYSFSQLQSESATQTSQFGITQTVLTLAAGTQVVVATMKSSTGTPALFRSGNRAFLLVEDMGPS
jgi:hypothetical protein